MTTTTSMLRTALDRFADRHELTAREYDVVFLLVSGLSTVAQIAERLGLSQNTVHNHFKNVFRRTSTNSKAGLLSLFLNDTMGQHAGLQPFVRKPMVLVVDPDPKTRAAIRDALTARNMRVEEEVDSRNAVARVSELRTDVVVTDAALPGSTGQGVLADLRAQYGKHPLVILTTTDNTASRREWTDRGAAGLFAKPVSLDRLAFAILEHLADTPFDRSRLLRVETELRAKLDDRLEVELGNLGFGGAFIPLAGDQMSRDAYAIGQRLRVVFSLDGGEPINATCEVMWRRTGSRPSMRSGVGVRFLNLSDSHRAAVEEFVRKRKLTGFMPWTEVDTSRRGSRRAHA